MPCLPSRPSTPGLQGCFSGTMHSRSRWNSNHIGGNMKRKGALAVLGIVVVVAAVAAIGVVAYNMGVNNGGDGGHGVFGPMMRGYRGGTFGMGAGGWWGVFPAMLLGFVVVVVLVALLAGSGRGTPAPAPRPSGDPPSGLRELVEMHDRGALTDDEFTAAKRRLLGL
jgi:hypothetical protein